MPAAKAKNNASTNSIGRSLGKGTKGSSSSSINNAASINQKSKLVGIQKQDGNNNIKRDSIDNQRRSSSPVYSKEQLEEADGREKLNPNDPKFNSLWKETQTKMGMPKHEPIHSKGMNRIELILRVFDLDPSFGPCLGMTRLERWERAEKLGDEPPMQIREILETREGILDLKYSVLHDKGV